MVRLDFAIRLHYDIQAPGGDFIFNFHAARSSWQNIIQESLEISQPLAMLMHTDSETRARYLRLSARAGQLSLVYQAQLELVQHRANPADVAEIPVAQLPPEVLTYLYPSRYCESDRLVLLSMQLFGHLPQGYRRVEAIQAWVRQQVSFVAASSNATTTALDTLNAGQGVCRDFAHLMIAVCRAVNIPARFTTGIDYGADPALGPTDFHAYVEVYLGHRWYIFDPSGTAIPMGFIRIGTGRDAADAAFATIFGAVTSEPPDISIVAHENPDRGWVLPVHCPEALSTDAG